MTRRALDLFAGAGNATIGIEAAGYDVTGFEWNADACATSRAAGHTVIRCDLSSYPWRRMPDVDLIHGSPPCQPFSSAGDGAGEDDDRDGMPWFLRAVDVIRPRLVTVENVPGLAHTKHGSYFGAFLRSLEGMGYDVAWRILNAADFGVPQTRRRLIVVARRDGEPIAWPSPTHTEGGGLFTEPWVSMADALGWSTASLSTGMNSMKTSRDPADMVPYERPIDRPAPAVTGLAAGAWRHGDTGHRQPPHRWKVTAGRSERATERSIDEPAPTVLARKAPNDWTVTRPATTIAGDTRVHPPGHKINADDIAHGRTGHDRAGTDAIRVTLTLDELAALQSFPPGYPFQGNRTSIARQIGNALPHPLIAAVVRANTTREATA